MGIPEGLLDRLHKEDDWSFLIKVHALLETALGYVIKAALRREELALFIERLNMGGRTGKLEFAKALGLLEDRHVAYLNLLAELRNRVVHSIQNVSFTLADYLAGRTKEQRAQFAITGLALPKNAVADTADGDPSRLLANPISLLWTGAMTCLNYIYLQDQRTERDRLQAQLYESYYRTNNIGFRGFFGGHENSRAVLQRFLRNYVPSEPKPAGDSK